MSKVFSWPDAVGQIFAAIPDLATPAQVQAALRDILSDPGLELYWWDWERDVYRQALHQLGPIAFPGGLPPPPAGDPGPGDGDGSGGGMNG